MCVSDFLEYLAAKRTVDDRALNRRVWDRFVSELNATTQAVDRPLRIVEVGTGIGSMIGRLADWEALSGTVSYRAVDLNESCIAAARERVPDWLTAAGYDVESAGACEITATHAATDTRLKVSFEQADARAITDEADAVIAAAFLDIVEVARLLDAFRDVIRDGGFLYAPCTYDGATHFSPAHPRDDRIETLYHRHMDEIRDLPGGSRAGRTVLERAPEHGYEVVAVGGGDWVVRPKGDALGGYPNEEGAFLDHLLTTIDGALAEYPNEVLDPAIREEWTDVRRDQRAAGTLTLIAHHLDLLARVEPAT